ncbi:hypothetical protein RCL_jg8614.t1 [Rhizophagus clarus]|uniref:Transmembrane protein n=1 Tax=Rhizophagus clarus TaxID=94130 RepID=A0A8H3M3N3_9GLOM|nr:hypothetical protein RCL_jg8614.t1 [Rhizophagus clarus]
MPQFQAKTTKKRVINNSELIIVNISFCSSWTMGVINLLAFNSWTMNVMNTIAQISNSNENFYLFLMQYIKKMVLVFDTWMMAVSVMNLPVFDSWMMDVIMNLLVFDSLTIEIMNVLIRRF